jgi:hypothetical protein
MPDDLRQWAKLHAVSASLLHERWSSNPNPKVDEKLLGSNRFDSKNGVWVVTSELEMVRLIGALQWQNPELKLWFRGETRYFPSALPSRIRKPKSQSLTSLGVRWLNHNAFRDRALRDRGPIARLAILQHYGCPTSLLDVSASYDVACAFAFASSTAGQAHLRVYALPRQSKAINIFDDFGVMLVDLNAELPSYCARPHVQQAAFLARTKAVYRDIECRKPVPGAEATVDSLCIAHLRLQFEGKRRFYEPRQKGRILYPQPSRHCGNCGANEPDMNGDYLLHILQCYKDPTSPPKPKGFPDDYSPTLTGAPRPPAGNK